MGIAAAGAARYVARVGAPQPTVALRAAVRGVSSRRAGRGARQTVGTVL